MIATSASAISSTREREAGSGVVSVVVTTKL
jgi:hypothetical protein